MEDTSITGTSLNDQRLKAHSKQELRNGDRLLIGPVEFRAELETPRTGDDKSSIQMISAVEIARLNTDKVLKSALELPGRLGAVTDESEVYRVACEYLVSTLSPAIESANVLKVPDDFSRETEILGTYAQENEKRNDAPLLSRRVVERLVNDTEQVIFIHRANPDVDIDATVASNTLALGASHIETAPDGEPIVLYITGSRNVTSGESILAEYLRLVAVLTKQHLVTLRQAALSKFFSPRVIQILMQRGGEAKLRGAPWIAEATSLFFDLRGFSLSTEARTADLLDLHADLRSVIDAVTNEVFEHDGTVIDYQGDGIFAAWGVPFSQPDQATSAVKCALGIISRLEAMDLAVFQEARKEENPVCGIGIAKGEVVAGGVGAGRMFKFGIIGPSVNLAARLESLTKPIQLNAPILVSKDIILSLPNEIPYRRVGTVRPAGMQTHLDVFEIIIKDSQNESVWNEQHDELWANILSSLEGAQTQEDLVGIENSLSSLPNMHPRTMWLMNMVKKLTKKTLEKWDGVIIQSKN